MWFLGYFSMTANSCNCKWKWWESRRHLCNIPPALFDPSGFPRQTNNTALSDSIWSIGRGLNIPYSSHCEDISCARWWITTTKGTTFDANCSMYVGYVEKKSPAHCCIWWLWVKTLYEGSDTPSPSWWCCGSEVELQWQHTCHQERKLSGPQNQHIFVSMLSRS